VIGDPRRRGAGTVLRRRLPLFATVLVVLVAAAALAGLRPAPAAATVSSQIAAILARGGLDNGSVGVDVWNLDAGTRIFAQNPGTPLAPASNMKLVTAATALQKWGLEHRFQTMIYAPQADAVDGTVDGDL
jgi:serine-type D-Ala-D-Ala carboxypeptidase/endopeptidase (penicillin-binding protein 4)